MNLKINSKFYTYHVLISKATINNSLRIKAVKEMETIFINSSSKRTIDIIIIAPPKNMNVN